MGGTTAVSSRQAYLVAVLDSSLDSALVVRGGGRRNCRLRLHYLVPTYGAVSTDQPSAMR
eukprot:1139081-Rhodomonas_salina.1